MNVMPFPAIRFVMNFIADECVVDNLAICASLSGWLL